MKIDDVYDELLSITADVGASLMSPIESEYFFSNIVEHFDGTREQLLEFIRENIHNWYRSANNEPDWLQSPEWRFFNNRPMVFVGQINIPGGGRFLHDDASFYVFWDPDSGVTDVIVQVA